MTDEEKAEELTTKQFDLDTDKVRYFCNLYKNDYHEVHTFYNGVLKGIAEGREENEKLNKKIRRYEEMLGSMFAACNMITQEQSKYEELRRL